MFFMCSAVVRFKTNLGIFSEAVKLKEYVGRVFPIPPRFNASEAGDSLTDVPLQTDEPTVQFRYR